MATLDQINALRPVKSITIRAFDNPKRIGIMLEFANGGAFGWCCGPTVHDAILNLDNSSLLNDMVNNGGQSPAA